MLTLIKLNIKQQIEVSQSHEPSAVLQASVNVMLMLIVSRGYPQPPDRSTIRPSYITVPEVQRGERWADARYEREAPKFTGGVIARCHPLNRQRLVGWQSRE